MAFEEITEWLREKARLEEAHGAATDLWKRPREAADEIDRLRAYVHELEEALRPFAAMVRGCESWDVVDSRGEPRHVPRFPHLAWCRAAHGVLDTGERPRCGAKDPFSPRVCDLPMGHDGDHDDSTLPVNQVRGYGYVEPHV